MLHIHFKIQTLYKMARVGYGENKNCTKRYSKNSLKLNVKHLIKNYMKQIWSAINAGDDQKLHRTHWCTLPHFSRVPRYSYVSRPPPVYRIYTSGAYRE